MFLILLELALINLSFVVLIGNLSSSVFHIVLELSLVDSVVDLHLTVTVFLTIDVLSFVVISVRSGKDSSSVELVALDTSFVTSSGSQLNATVLIFPLIVNIVSFVDVSVRKFIFTMTVFFAVSEMPLILISVNFQSSVTVEDTVVKISLIIKSILFLLKVSFSMIFSVNETAPINGAISVLDLSSSVELVVLEIPTVFSSVPGDEVSFASFASVFDRSFVL